MIDIPWHAPARLVDRIGNKYYVGTLKAALRRWIRLPKEAQALAIVNLEARWEGPSALRAADLRELLLESGAPMR